MSANPATRAAVEAAAEYRRELGADAFGQRSIADLVGEAMRRTYLGAIRPLWHDLPEVEKATWRQAGLDAIRAYCRAHAKRKAKR